MSSCMHVGASHLARPESRPVSWTGVPPREENAILTRSNNHGINSETLSEETGFFPATSSLSTD